MKVRIFLDGVKKTSVDISNPLVEIFMPVAPYTIDNETGEVINKSNRTILISNGFMNIDEKIQSFEEDCNLYKILEKMALSGDSSLLNRKSGIYVDISNIPDNLNDFNNNLNSLSSDKNLVDVALGFETEKKENLNNNSEEKTNKESEEKVNNDKSNE